MLYSSKNQTYIISKDPKIVLWKYSVPPSFTDEIVNVIYSQMPQGPHSSVSKKLTQKRLSNFKLNSRVLTIKVLHTYCHTHTHTEIHTQTHWTYVCLRKNYSYSLLKQWKSTNWKRIKGYHSLRFKRHVFNSFWVIQRS